MYLEKILEDLTVIGHTLKKLEGVQGRSYKSFKRVIAEIKSAQQAFGVVRWFEEDIQCVLDEHAATLKPSQLTELINEIDKPLTSLMIEKGWEIINFYIEDYLNRKEGK
jgi:hypothetical protein